MHGVAGTRCDVHREPGDAIGLPSSHMLGGWTVLAFVRLRFRFGIGAFPGTHAGSATRSAEDVDRHDHSGTHADVGHYLGRGLSRGGRPILDSDLAVSVHSIEITERRNKRDRSTGTCGQRSERASARPTRFAGASFLGGG